MLIQANALNIPLKDESVQCVVTSPPYWGLRDYGTATWEGASEGCDHRANGERRQLSHGDGRVNDCYADERVLIPGAGANFKDFCGKCGATRIDSQLGLEKTPEEYVANMVQVFREVRRVLRDDGTLWLNLGDTYTRAPEKGGSGPNGKNGDYSDAYTLAQSAKVGSSDGAVGRADRPGSRAAPAGLKPKDIVGIPWRVALALQADGWYLRSDIIWSKPNPMPESVTDRPTKSHEYVFLLAKSAKYYFDQDAVRESGTKQSPMALSFQRETKEADVPGQSCRQHRLARKVRSPAGWKTGPGSHGSIHENGREPEVKYVDDVFTRRNIRSVWTIATQPYAEAHFATFPEALVKPCVLAGSKPGDIVFDPFGGSCTVVKVAQDLGRHGVALDLKWEYLQLGQRRAAQQGLGI